MGIRRKKAAAVQAPKPTLFDIGYGETVETFRQACGDAGAWGELQRGAIKAFHEDRPENIQALLANPGAFLIKGNDDIKKAHCRNILYQLTQGREQAADIITHAIEKIPEQQRQKFLDDILYSTIDCDSTYQDEESFDAALMGAGAKANAENNGSGGRTLAMAINHGHSVGIIKQLYDNGGVGFEAALHRIRTRPFWDEGDKREKCIEKLMVYRREITGESATVEVKPELLLHMQQTIDELTLRVETLTKPSVSATLAKPLASAAVQSSRRVLKT